MTKSHLSSQFGDEDTENNVELERHIDTYGASKLKNDTASAPDNETPMTETWSLCTGVYNEEEYSPAAEHERSFLSDLQAGSNYTQIAQENNRIPHVPCK